MFSSLSLLSPKTPLFPKPSLSCLPSEKLEQLLWARGRVSPFAAQPKARAETDRELSCSCFRCDNDAGPLALPLRPRAFITLWGAAVTPVVWEVAPWGLLLGTWAGLLQAGQKKKKKKNRLGSALPRRSLGRRWICLDLEGSLNVISHRVWGRGWVSWHLPPPCSVAGQAFSDPERSLWAPSPREEGSWQTPVIGWLGS